MLCSFPSYSGPSHHDLAVSYRTEFSSYYETVNKTKNGNLKILLDDLKTSDTKGPYCDESKFQCIPINLRIPDKCEL